MRQILLIAVMLLCAVGAHAQRYLPGQYGIEITAGVADGFEMKRGDGRAFYGNLSMSTYNSKGNRWVFGAEYFERLYGYGAELIPAAQITAEAGPARSMSMRFAISTCSCSGKTTAGNTTSISLPPRSKPRSNPVSMRYMRSRITRVWMRTSPPYSSKIFNSSSATHRPWKPCR